MVVGAFFDAELQDEERDRDREDPVAEAVESSERELVLDRGLLNRGRLDHR